MDDAELNWHLDDVSLSSFMANYAPMPGHLRKRRGVVVDNVNLGEEDIVEELGHGADVAGDERGGAFGDENVVASDLEDYIPLIKRKRADEASSSVVTPKCARRRLIKKHVNVDVGDVACEDLEASTLNIPAGQIPTNVFELGSAISNISGDFFMGLSSDVDPTKDLPPVTGMGGDVIGMDEDTGVVNRPVDKGKKVIVDDDGKSEDAGIAGMGTRGDVFDATTMLDVVDESIPSHKPVEQCKEKGAPQSLGVGGSGVRSRLKKSVPARHLGLMNRDQVRQSQQIVYSSSSEDDVEENPETGEKRTRVGWMFKTAPRSILSNFLTDDDKWKLEGCSFRCRVKRAEKVAGMVVGEISGLTDSLLAERSRSLRLMKRKRGLEVEVAQMKENALAAVSAEKERWEKKVTDLQNQLSGQEEVLKTVRELAANVEKREIEAAAKLREQLNLTSELENKVKGSAAALRDAEEAMLGVRGQNDELRSQLDAMPSKENILSEFQSSDVYKKEILDARAAGVAAYKASAEFESEMKLQAERAIAQYKESADYAAKIDELKMMLASEYSKSVDFRQAVGMEAGKMSKHVVECCREFFKDDLNRPGSEFGDFFFSFVQQRRRRDVGASSFASVCKSST